jgi:hypothetical protein
MSVGSAAEILTPYSQELFWGDGSDSDMDGDDSDTDGDTGDDEEEDDNQGFFPETQAEDLEEDFHDNADDSEDEREREKDKCSDTETPVNVMNEREELQKKAKGMKIEGLKEYTMTDYKKNELKEKDLCRLRRRKRERQLREDRFLKADLCETLDKMEAAATGVGSMQHQDGVALTESQKRWKTYPQI